MTRDPEDILRAAFAARAERAWIAPDALGSIRTRVARRTRRRRTMTATVTSLATGAAATVTAVIVGLSSCLPPESGPPAGPLTPAIPTTGPTGSPSTAPARVAVRVPVYFAADLDQRIVLFRETHAGTAPADTPAHRIGTALTIMISGRTLDPDYASLWPANASVTSVRIEGDVAVVDLAGAATNSVGAAAARIAIQQLVWTTTAVTAERGTQLRGVRLLFDGRAVPEAWGHVATAGVLTRDPQGQTLAPVWLISPQHGDTVGSTVRVHLAGSVPEATVQLWVRDSAGAVVRRSTVTLSVGGPGRGDAIVSVHLTPGRYVLEAFYESLEDGGVRGLDDHEVTVS